MKNLQKFVVWGIILSFVVPVTGCHTGGGNIIPGPFGIQIQFTGESYAGDGFVQLDWQDYPLQETSFVGYVLSRGPSAQGPWTVIAEIPDRSEYRDTGVTNGVNYWYSLQVKRRDGSLSQRVIGGPFRPHSDTTPPAEPTNLVAGAGDGIVVLFWNSFDSSVVEFRIYRNTAPSVPTTPRYFLASVPGTERQYNDTAVVNRTTYWYVVTAVDADGNESGPSNIASATPLPDTTPPETTIDLAPPALSNSAAATFVFSSNETGSTFECERDGSGFSSCTSPAFYSGLSDGSHTFRVRAVDLSGNVDPTPAVHTWEIDTTPPDTVISGGPADPTNQTSASFNLQSNESPVTFECSLDNSPFTTCASPVNFTNLSEGSHTFAARARDLAGNVDPTPGSHTWTVDITPPTLTLTQSPDPNTNQTTASFDWSSSEPATFECRLDNASFAACSKPAVYSGLAEGSHTFAVRGTDNAGNTGSPTVYNWVVDVTPPGITNLSGPPAYTNSTVANFSWQVNDNLSGVAAVECHTVNVDPAFRSCATQTSDVVSGLSSGAQVWHIRARDQAGNQSQTLEWNWYVDITGPGVTVLSPNGGENLAAGSTVTIQWTAIDTAQSGLSSHTVQYSVDGGNTWTDVATCVNLPAISTSCDWNVPNDAGVVTTTGRIKVISTDQVGNAGEDVSDANFTISDQTPPSVSVVAPAAGATVQADPPPYTIQWNSSDNIGIAEHDLYLSLDGGITFDPIPECTNVGGNAQTCDWDPPNVNEFDAVIRVCATDVTAIAPAPHTTCATSGEFSIVYDTTPPEAPTITLGPAEGSYSNQNSATFEFTANDPPPNASGINRYECDLDGGGFVPCTSPQTYTNLPDAAHTFKVRAVDNAGNIGPETVRNWTSDTTAPTLTVGSPNGGEFIAGNTTWNINWTASDATSGLDGTAGSATVEYSTDNGGTWVTAVGCENATSQNTSCSWNVPGVDSNQALVRVTVRDLAANTTTDTSDAVFTIDSTPPVASLTNGPCGLATPCFTNSTSATFEFTGTDNFSPPANLTFECQLDSGDPTACTSPQTYDNLTPGPHSFVVRAIDQAGNVGAWTSPFEWSIDIDPPTITVTFPDADTDYVLVPGTNTITWTATDTGVSGLSYFNIELSEDDGVNWAVLAAGVPEATACPTPPNCSYAWTITDPDKFNRTNRIRITAYDAAGNWAQDQSDNNFSYAFYERFESEADPVNGWGEQHPTTALRRWWQFGFGPPGTPYTCPDDPPGQNLFRWFFAPDSIFGPQPQDNHTPNWFRWAVCQTGLTYFYPPAPNEQLGLVAGPFPFTDTTSADLIMKMQWSLDPQDELYLLVSPALASETSACNTASGSWQIFSVGITGTSPNFGTAFETVAVNLETLAPDLMGSTRCLGLLLLDQDGDGSEWLTYFGPMMDDFTVIKY